jgi:short-subunit dehydrogenase
MPGATHAALVTGASSGIGFEIARILAREGRDLFLVARSPERLDAAERALRAEGSGSVSRLAVDLTRSDAVERIVQSVATGDVHIDFLVNNAGVGLLGRFHETALDEQRDLIRLNVEALVGLTHAFLPGMIRAGGGIVLNVASMAGFTPGPLMATYYASKAFVRSFSEGLARELDGTGVTVSTLYPGPVPTGFQLRAGYSWDSKATIHHISARKVAEIGVNGARSGRRIIVPGILNKVLAAASRFVPARVAANAVFKVQSSRLDEAET